jgi:hypothetical protein
MPFGQAFFGAEFEFDHGLFVVLMCLQSDVCLGTAPSFTSTLLLRRCSEQLWGFA